jgi:hypothetical protein
VGRPAIAAIWASWMARALAGTRRWRKAFLGHHELELVRRVVQTFTSLVCEAPAEFLAHWHEGETPSRIWVNDRHGYTDIEDRLRRVITTRRKEIVNSRKTPMEAP